MTAPSLVGRATLDAVAEILLGLDLQRLAALAVVLASMVADTDLTASTTAYEHAAA